MSHPALQGLRRWAKSLHHCLWPALLVLASLAATCGHIIITFEAAYCCETSAFRSGIPRPPCAGRRANSSRNSSGRGSVWWKRSEGKYHWSLHQLVPHSLQKSQLYAQNFGAVCEGDVGGMGMTLYDLRQQLDVFPPTLGFSTTSLVWVQWLFPGVVDLPLL